MAWLPDWTYRKSHIIDPASGAGQNYQMRVVVHYTAGVDSGENVYLGGKCLADFGDVRFVGPTGVFLLDYWIEEKVDGDYAVFWVEVVADLSVYDANLFIYYGKSGASSIANGDATFIFFDDFEVDLSKWLAFPSGGATLSADHAYSGAKCIKLAQSTSVHRLQGPTGNKAVHAHFYDEMSPLTELTVFSIDAGESEESFIGLFTDGTHYEYQLDDVVYDSGIDRTVGWHEFVARCTVGLKQFFVDGSLMPVTGSENYAVWNGFINSGPPFSEAVVYWDTVFMRKFVNPEPAHGAWGSEKTEAEVGTTTYIAEDIGATILAEPLVLEEVPYSLAQVPLSAEDAFLCLSLSGPHLPPFPLDDSLVALLVARRQLMAEDLAVPLNLSLHLPFSFEEMTTSLFAGRVFGATKEFVAAEVRYPIIGGTHIVQVEGEE